MIKDEQHAMYCSCLIMLLMLLILTLNLIMLLILTMNATTATVLRAYKNREKNQALESHTSNCY